MRRGCPSERLPRESCFRTSARRPRDPHGAARRCRAARPPPADVADEGLEVGSGCRPGRGTRQRADRDRQHGVGPGEGLHHRALHVIRRSATDRIPPARWFMPKRLASRFTAERPSGSGALPPGGGTCSRLTYALPHHASRLGWSSPGLPRPGRRARCETMLVRSTRCCAGDPLREVSAQVKELRTSLTTMRGDALGASDLVRGGTARAS